MSGSQSAQVLSLLAEAKSLAKAYRALTGRPLGITGEVAEFEAVRLLGLQLAEVRQAGFDAIRSRNGRLERLQIKGRCLVDDSKRGHKVGAIRLAHPWDSVLLVLMDADFEATVIYEADRKAIERALSSPGSIARNSRGQLAVSKFKKIGQIVWRRDPRPK